MSQRSDILLIDDDETSNLISEIILKNSQLFNSIDSVLSAENALNKINLAAENEAENLPSIIFLDLNMPEMDGWEFLDQFAEFNTDIIDKIDIYILSSSQNPDDVIRAAKHPYVKDFINKPLNLKILEKKFNT